MIKNVFTFLMSFLLFFPTFGEKICTDIWTIDNENLKNLVGKEFEIWGKNSEVKDSKIVKKNPTWTRNERIIVLRVL